MTAGRQTFRQILARRMILPATLLASALLAAGFASFMRASSPTTAPLVPLRAETLLTDHDCWSGAAPADMVGKLPGHAVVTTADGRTVYSAAMVGPALDHVFKGMHPGLVVNGFCR